MILVSVNLAFAAFMTGVIWFVQLIHYPMMHEVEEPAFRGYQHEYTRKIKWLVGPAMAAELLASAALAFWRPAGVSAWIVWPLLLAVTAIWASTFLIQVPCHDRLSEGFSRKTHQKLVSSNWIRTVLWSGRTGALTIVATQVFID